MDAIAAKTTRGSIEKLAASQFGLISYDQALSLGLTPSAIKHQVSSGRWNRLHRGVYAIAGTPNSWHQALLAASLSAGKRSLASHRSAAALLQMDGFRPGPIEVSTTKNLRRTSFTIHRVDAWPRCDVSRIHGIPATDPARTLLDLAAITAPQPLEIAFHDVLTRLISVSRLAWRLNFDNTKGKRGVGLLREWLEEIGPHGRPAGSGFEVLLYRLLVEAGLPRPVRQHPIRVDGRTRYADLAYPDFQLIIEALGYKAHRGKLKWESDFDRGNQLEAAGWHLLHITWDQYKRDPQGIVALVRRFL
jgi:very-short-patch-repair endonuclease